MRIFQALVLALVSAVCSAAQTSAPYATAFAGDPPYQGPPLEMVNDGSFAVQYLVTGGYIVDYMGNFNTGGSFGFKSRTGTPQNPGQMIMTNLVNGGLVDTNPAAPSSDIDLVYLSKGKLHIVGVQGEYHGLPSALIAWPPEISLGRSTNPWAQLWIVEDLCPKSMRDVFPGLTWCIRVNGGYTPLWR